MRIQYYRIAFLYTFILNAKYTAKKGKKSAAFRLLEVMLYNENAIVWDHICCCMNFPLIFVLSREGDTAARSNGSTTARHCFPPRKAAASIPYLHSRYIHIISLDLYYITTCSTWFNKYRGFTAFFCKKIKNRHSI